MSQDWLDITNFRFKPFYPSKRELVELVIMELRLARQLKSKNMNSDSFAWTDELVAEFAKVYASLIINGLINTNVKDVIEIYKKEKCVHS